jgi:HAD superfamily hydrolase (TIGR01509 family)
VGVVTLRGVLFDFSGTLFHLEPEPGWFDGLPVDRTKLIDVLTSPTSSGYLPDELMDAWERRDLDQETHRMVYLAVLRAAEPGAADEVLGAIYERVPDPASWTPYPDTFAALRGLRDAGIPVAVISNIAWDVRSVFHRNGMADLVGEYVLSYAEGVMKPDPKIFLSACQRIGVAPEHTLMIGDNEVADGGARQIGCRFAAVERIPPADRPDALISALSEYGMATQTSYDL